MITPEEAESVRLPIGDPEKEDEQLSLFSIGLGEGGACFLAFFSQLDVAEEAAGVADDGEPFTYKEAIEAFFDGVCEEDCECEEGYENN